MQYKGSGLVFLKKQLRERGQPAEDAFLSKVSASDGDYYRDTLAFHWVPIAVVNRCYVQAAPILYPGDVTALRRVGADLARDQMPTIYRMIARAMTVPMLMEQSARIWRTYHSKGEAHSRKGEGPNQVVFVVEDYPELPERFRECICGFIAALIEMTGAKDVKVAKSNDDPASWQWRVVWK